MRKYFLFFVILASSLVLSCTSLPTTTGREIVLDGKTIREADLGELERWYAVDLYSSDIVDKVLFQVAWIKTAENLGYVIYGNGNEGVTTYFDRDGLNLRWDWGENWEYCIVIHPDNCGYYYDFSGTNGKNVKPRAAYKMYKF